jgi:7-cyano-7-deazaguanine synthase in queuosine biosynthesis
MQGTKVLLSSGGMDSALLAGQPELQDSVHVFVDVGQQYSLKEEEAAQCVAYNNGSVLERVKATNMARYEHKSGIIPFRNAELILSAAQYGTEIFLGVIADEINSDKSVEFCTAMQSVLNISHRKQYWTEGLAYTIHTPFRNMTKTQLLRRYMEKGGSMHNMLQTVSCYSATDKHCGCCSSCFKRWVALANVQHSNDWKQWGFEANPALYKTPSEWTVTTQAYSTQRSDEVWAALGVAGISSTSK